MKLPALYDVTRRRLTVTLETPTGATMVGDVVEAVRAYADAVELGMMWADERPPGVVAGLREKEVFTFGRVSVHVEHKLTYPVFKLCRDTYAAGFQLILLGKPFHIPSYSQLSER